MLEAQPLRGGHSMDKRKKLFRGVFMWQTLKRALEQTLIRETIKRNVDPWELLKGLENPARVSRALDALLHDLSVKEPPP